MSLPILPSECLAHIFSFSDYSTLANCRLANIQFNQIIKNYKIQRLKVKSVNIVYRSQQKLVLVTVIPSPKETEQLVFRSGIRKRKFRYEIFDTQSVQDVLIRNLLKIEHSDNVYFYNLDITEQFLLLSHKFGERFWNCKHLIFQCCSFSMSTEYMKHLTNVIKPQLINFSNCMFHNEQIYSAECLNATFIHFENPSLPSFDTRTPQLLNDQYLNSFGDRVFDVSFKFDNAVTGFTFRTVRKLINERLERNNYPGTWDFGIIRYGNWTLDDYNNFVEYYDASRYYCSHRIDRNTAFAGIKDVNRWPINIRFQTRPNEAD